MRYYSLNKLKILRLFRACFLDLVDIFVCTNHKKSQLLITQPTHDVPWTPPEDTLKVLTYGTSGNS